MLNDLKSRGVMDVYLFCTDGLCGMMEAIRAVYPQIFDLLRDVPLAHPAGIQRQDFFLHPVLGEHESSKFWLNVLNDLKSRGVMDVYLFCTDGLRGSQRFVMRCEAR